jgi:hypothetical protein
MAEEIFDTHVGEQLLVSHARDVICGGNAAVHARLRAVLGADGESNLETVIEIRGLPRAGKTLFVRLLERVFTPALARHVDSLDDLFPEQVRPRHMAAGHVHDRVAFVVANGEALSPDATMPACSACSAVRSAKP